MSLKPIPVHAALLALGRAYEAAGHRIVLVGGCVRDHVRGVEAKDVDLATSATPEEQVALCEANGWRWFATGLQHGTLTVLAGDEAYEITTFRTDVETDGRHAVVAYTRDLAVDLARRDLTMNAIAMTLDGEVADPFGGVADALAGNVRFVGEPVDRIREDYLRILRWFRFLGRFGADLEAGTPDAAAITREAAGLARISVERVWSEVSRILAGPRPAGVLDLMDATGVLKALRLPSAIEQGTDCLAEMRRHTNDPGALLGAWLGPLACGVADRWKLSNAERTTVAFASDRVRRASYGLADAKADLVDGADRGLVETVLRTRGARDALRALLFWETPEFPLKGRDLLAAGMRPGKAVGERLAAMRAAWIASDYAMDADALTAAVPDGAAVKA